MREYAAAYKARTGRPLWEQYRQDDLHTGNWIGKRRRLAIYERDNWTCWLCGEAVDRDVDPRVHDRAPSLDHVIPRSRNGSHDDDNLRTAHRLCNTLRGVADVAVT